MCRIERPFARTLNGQIPPRYSPLDSGSPRNNLGLARSPFVLRTFPPRAGATRRLSGGGRPPSGLLSLAEPAYAPRPSPAATTVLMTGFRQRFARPLRRLSRLVAGTAGGSCVGDPVSSRSLPVYLYSVVFLQRLRKVALTFRDAAILRFPCSAPNALGSALVVYITTYVAGIKCLNRGLRRFRDWWDFVGV